MQAVCEIQICSEQNQVKPATQGFSFYCKPLFLEKLSHKRTPLALEDAGNSIDPSVFARITAAGSKIIPHAGVIVGNRLWIDFAIVVFHHGHSLGKTRLEFVLICWITK